MPDYSLEKEYASKGYKVICGVDEAGRGPLCGPVFAAACVLPEGLEIEGLNDSKKLIEKKREKLFDIIKEKAIAYCIASASVEEINKLNILEADLLAMRRAIEGLSVKADFALIDGNINRGFDIDSAPIIKGDATSMSIAAASVLAKVARDRICIELDAEYPQYKIAKNKGYGTKDHISALFEYGPSPIHREKFIRFLDEKQ
ncbi:MAG: ribonuclease HII [Ruminococcaceae bacterium]|nr:ribonuclease HII [Oscillospiraceae bacterium]